MGAIFQLWNMLGCKYYAVMFFYHVKTQFINMGDLVSCRPILNFNLLAQELYI